MTGPVHPERIAIGGLFRCSTKTIYENIASRTTNAENGTILKCRWCDQRMIFEDGIWRWHEMDGN